MLAFPHLGICTSRNRLTSSGLNAGRKEKKSVPESKYLTDLMCCGRCSALTSRWSSVQEL